MSLTTREPRSHEVAASNMASATARHTPSGSAQHALSRSRVAATSAPGPAHHCCFRVQHARLLSPACPALARALPLQFAMKRQVVGIWKCKACNKVQAGGAYVLK